MLYIGKDVSERMGLLGLSEDEVANKTFIKKEIISAIIQEKIAFEEIDDFDLDLLCSILHCKPEFFTNEEAKEKDLLLASLHRELDSEKSRKIKAKIQDFMDDFAFVAGISTTDT